jgi:hypothetical protein
VAVIGDSITEQRLYPPVAYRPGVSELFFALVSGNRRVSGGSSDVPELHHGCG